MFFGGQNIYNPRIRISRSGPTYQISTYVGPKNLVSVHQNSSNSPSSSSTFYPFPIHQKSARPPSSSPVPVPIPCTVPSAPAAKRAPLWAQLGVEVERRNARGRCVGRTTRGKNHVFGSVGRDFDGGGCAFEGSNSSGNGRNFEGRDFEGRDFDRRDCSGNWRGFDGRDLDGRDLSGNGRVLTATVSTGAISAATGAISTGAISTDAILTETYAIWTGGSNGRVVGSKCNWKWVLS